MTKEESLNMIFAFRIFWKNKIKLMIYSLIAAILAMIISFILPKTYTAKATLIVPETSSGISGIASSLGILNPSLSLEGGITSQTLKSILESKTCLDLVINEFDMMKIYKASDIEKARKILTKRTNIGIFYLLGTIEIEVRDRDPERAAKICNYYIEILEIINKELRLSIENPIVKTLDFATTPLKKSFPKTKINMVFAFSFTFFATLIYTMLKEWNTNQK